MGTRRRKRALTSEERALWRKVAETLDKSVEPQRREAPAAPPTPPNPQPKPAPIAAEPAPRPTPHVRPKTPTAGLDRRTAERLRKGRRDPDARLDLHGMTADRALGALKRFIGESRRQGHRCVLVITGKGAEGAREPFGAPSPGVLRREAPIWLSSWPLADQVVSVTEAHPRHGGGGALYVYLKRTRRDR